MFKKAQGGWPSFPACQQPQAGSWSQRHLSKRSHSNCPQHTPQCLPAEAMQMWCSHRAGSRQLKFAVSSALLFSSALGTIFLPLVFQHHLIQLSSVQADGCTPWDANVLSTNGNPTSFPLRCPQRPRMRVTAQYPRNPMKKRLWCACVCSENPLSPY